VDAARAERHLRLVAEAELRRVRVRDQAEASPALRPGEKAFARLSRVSETLTAVGALDGERAEALAREFRIALGVRGLDPPGLGLHVGRARLLRLRGFAPPLPFAGRGMGATSITALKAAAPALAAVDTIPDAAGPAATRVMPAGRMLPFREDEAHGEVYLLSLVITAGTATLPAVVHLRTPPSGPVMAAARAHILPFQAMTAVDDAGRPYHLVFSGGGRAGTWEGHFDIHPVPPPEARWLDVVSGTGQPAARIDLTSPARPADVTVEEGPSTPGERLLDAVAVGLLVGAALKRHPASQPAGVPGDLVTALEAAGALSALSPAPARLAGLCQQLGQDAHGIAVPPATELPGPWLDLIAHYGRRHQPRARDGIAALPVLLPELDGIQFGLAGLHTRDDQTTLSVVARGLPPMPDHIPAGPVAYVGSTWWLRDDGGRWHVAATDGWSADDGGRASLGLRVYPPLGRAVSSVELVVTGAAARLRAHLPLSWWAAL
jgi:hypothetical protein